MSTNHTFLSDVLTQLRSHKHGELQAIASGANVPEGTVRKLYYGEVHNPRVNTVEALHNYFASRSEAQEASLAPHTPDWLVVTNRRTGKKRRSGEDRRAIKDMSNA